MGKKDTRRRVINPLTNRKVLQTGKAYKEAREKIKAKAARRAKQTKSKPPAKKKATSTCVGGKCKKPLMYAFPCATKKPSPFVKTAGITKGCVARPSARAHFDIGDYGPKFYAGKVHIMVIDKLGRPSYKAL